MALNNIQNVAVLISTLKIGGAEKQSIILAKVLSKFFNVTLFVLYGDKIEKKQLNLVKNCGIRYILLEGSYLHKGIVFRNYIQQNNVDIVFCFLPRDNLFSGIFLIQSKCRHVIGGIRLDRNSLVKNIPLYIMVRVGIISNIIFNSYAAMKLFPYQKTIKKSCHVIHNCINSKEGVLQTTEELHNVKILSVGRFVKDKDYFTALQSIKYLETKCLSLHIKISYLIIGYGELEEDIRKWVKELRLQDIVKIIINPDNVDAYYDDSHIYLSTSRKEGVSNSIMEAMSYSLPIVATNVGDTSYLVHNEVNGFVCQQENPKEFSNKLYKIIVDNDLRPLMSNKSHEIITSDFSCKNFERKYIEFINHLND